MWAWERGRVRKKRRRVKETGEAWSMIVWEPGMVVYMTHEETYLEQSCIQDPLRISSNVVKNSVLPIDRRTCC